MARPSLTGFAPSATFAENTVNATPQIIDSDVTFTDIDNDFDGGTLVVSGLLAEDRISVRNQGTGAGEIGFNSGTGEITYGGVVIGTATGGSGATFTVTFNASATSVAIDSLIQNLTYANVSDTPTAGRTLAIAITDAGGNSLLEGPFGGWSLPSTDPIIALGIHLPIFVAAGDVDGDGDDDLMIYAGAPSRVEYVENLGDGAFAVRTGAANPFGGFSAQMWQPSFVDLDGDGDLDIVLGNNVAAMRYIKNTGSATAPVFVEQTGAANPFNSFPMNPPGNGAPDFADLDNDGDMDAVVGYFNGELGYFKNVGTASAPSFVRYGNEAGNPFAGLTVGRAPNPNAKPRLVDADGDGDLDVIVGTNKEGNPAYFENVGTASAPSFVERTGAANPFNDVTLGRYATVSFLDVDGDGDLDIVTFTTVGFNGVILNGANTTRITVDVTAEDEPPGSPPELADLASSVTFAENTVNAAPQLLDADVTFTDAEGDFDGGSLTVSGLLPEDRVAVRNQGTAAGQIGVSGSDITFGGTVIGTFSGGSGGALTVTFNANATNVAIEALIQNLTYANVSDTPTTTRTLTLDVVDADGERLGVQSLELATGAQNPFAGLAINGAAAPNFVDLDGDGDRDLVLANDDLRGVGFAENTGDDANPVFVMRTGAANPFNALTGATDFWGVTLADFDGDGDFDLLVTGQSELAYFRNNGTALAPSFAQLVGPSNPFGALVIGDVSRGASAGDLEGDGDLDLIIGTFASGILYAENTGTATSPVFVLRTGAANPFDGIDVNPAGVSNKTVMPTFVDLDGDGDLDVVAGEATENVSQDAPIYFIENVGSAADPAFVLRSGAGTLLDGFAFPRFFSTVGATDLDGDGDVDLVVMSYPDTFNVVLNQTGAVQITVNVTSEAEASPPSLAGLASLATFNENTVNAAPQLLDSDVTFTDTEGNFDGGTLLVQGLLAEDRVAVRNQGTGAGQVGVSGSNITYGGVTIGTYTGGSGANFTITFNASATSAAIDAVIQNLTYANVSNTPTYTRTLAIKITDAGGLSNGDYGDVINVRVNAESDNTAPILTGVIAALIVGSAQVTVIDGDVTLTDAEENFDGGTLVVSGLLAEDQVAVRNQGNGAGQVGVTGSSIKYGGTVIGTLSGGVGASLTITFNAAATEAAVDAVIQNLTYANANAASPTADRTLSVQVTDGEGATSASSSIVFTVLPGLVGTPNGDSLNGTTGNDTLWGLGGDDTIVGAGGNDTVHGGEGKDNITGVNGNDILYGDEGDDRVDGGAGDDAVYGGTGADKLFGGAGADILDGGVGPDQMMGGAGNDTYYVDDAGDVLAEAAGQGTDTVYSSVNIVLSDDIEILYLTGAALNATGNNVANTIYGGAGANVFSGGGNNDTLYGYAGNDTLNGDDGNDTLWGGDDNDTLNGGLGSDTLNGENGADVLNGGDATDTLLGGAGDDVLNGGAQQDSYTGGTGADRFIIDNTAIRRSGMGLNVQKDTLLDFSLAEGDRIDLSAVDANANLAGDQAFVFVSAFTSVAGQALIKYLAASNTTSVKLDVDGDGVADHEIVINGNVTTGVPILTGGEPASQGGWLL